MTRPDEREGERRESPTIADVFARKWGREPENRRIDRRTSDRGRPARGTGVGEGEAPIGFCLECEAVVTADHGEGDALGHTVPEHHHNCDPNEGCVGECPVPMACGPIIPLSDLRARLTDRTSPEGEERLAILLHHLGIDPEKITEAARHQGRNTLGDTWTHWKDKSGPFSISTLSKDRARLAARKFIALAALRTQGAEPTKVYLMQYMDQGGGWMWGHDIYDDEQDAKECVADNDNPPGHMSVVRYVAVVVPTQEDG